tara:strand:+ start:5768 stop:6328 length:561 start_codon:yes stop_codon:yes gene_type:complete
MVKFGQLSQAIILLSMMLLLLPSCQVITGNDSNNTSYGEYYLALQQLDQQQLAEEIHKQQLKVEQKKMNNSYSNFDPRIKLLLLYSLPKSPIYNSFNAKSLLNQLTSDEDNAAFTDINPSEQAFITLLRDQLNQRLLMRNRLLAQQHAQQELALQQQQHLVEQVQLLEQTIKQLKNIERAIDKREQ